MTTAFEPPLRWQSFQVPKGGNRPDELEDAVAGDPALGLFAIADGASDSLCADVWASLLTTEFTAHPPVHLADWPVWLAPLRRRWWEDVSSRKLSWPAEHKLAAGAAATLVGLRIETNATWTASAVGDSCLFQLRGAELVVRFPITHSDQFDNHPPLIYTRPGRTELQPRELRGGFQPGDQIWLMTDALAHWFLKQTEIGDLPGPQLESLFGLSSPDGLAAELAQLRRTRGLRNDDISCVLISIL